MKVKDRKRIDCTTAFRGAIALADDITRRVQPLYESLGEDQAMMVSDDLILKDFHLEPLGKSRERVRSTLIFSEYHVQKNQSI